MIRQTLLDPNKGVTAHIHLKFKPGKLFKYLSSGGDNGRVGLRHGDKYFPNCL